jgi:hypothetical protein
MKNKMIGILICILLVATVFPVTGTLNIQNALKRVTNDPVPDLDSKGDIVKKVVKSGSTITDSFIVENIGESGSLLDWEVAIWPDFGTNWTFNPSSGENLTPEYGPMTVTVTFTAPIVENNMYYGGVITIWAADNHNDYDLIAVNINVANHSAINTPLRTIDKNSDLSFIMPCSYNKPRPQFLELSDPPLIFSFNQRGLTISNVGIVTAQDVWWNISSEGGLLLVGNRHIKGTLTSLVPGASVLAKLGFMLGFGKMTFHIQAGATDVEPLDKYMTGTLVLFIILWFLN